MHFLHPLALLLLPLVLALWLLARRRGTQPRLHVVSSLRFWVGEAAAAARREAASPALRDALRALGLAALALSIAQPVLRPARTGTLHLLLDRSARMASRMREGQSVFDRAAALCVRWVEEARRGGRRVEVHLDPPLEGVEDRLSSKPPADLRASLARVPVAAREGDFCARAGSLVSILGTDDELRVLTLGRRGPRGEPVGVVAVEDLLPFDAALLRLDPRFPPGVQAGGSAPAFWWFLLRVKGSIPFPLILVAEDAQGEVARVVVASGVDRGADGGAEGGQGEGANDGLEGGLDGGGDRWLALRPSRPPVGFLSVRREGPADRLSLDDRLVRAVADLPLPLAVLDPGVPSSVERALRAAGARVETVDPAGESRERMADLRVLAMPSRGDRAVLPRPRAQEEGGPPPRVVILRPSPGSDMPRGGRLSRARLHGFPREVALEGASLGGAPVISAPAAVPEGWRPMLRARILSPAAAGGAEASAGSHGADSSRRDEVDAGWISGAEIRLLFDPQGTPWEEHPSYPLFWARVLEWAMRGRFFSAAGGAEVGDPLSMPRRLRGARFERVAGAGAGGADPRAERLEADGRAGAVPRWIPTLPGLHRLVAPGGVVAMAGVRPGVLVASDPAWWSSPVLPVGKRTTGRKGRQEGGKQSLGLALAVLAAGLLALAVLASSPR